MKNVLGKSKWNLTGWPVILKIAVIFFYYYWIYYWILKRKVGNFVIVKKKKWKIYKITRIYYDYEYGLYKNMFNLDFLIKSHTNLYNYINQLFNTRKHCVCCFLHKEFNSKRKNWFDGTVWQVSLSDAIEHQEKQL